MTRLYTSARGYQQEPKTYRFRSLLQSGGWLSPAFVCVNDHGIIQYISDAVRDAEEHVESVNGFAVPGFQNAHSHAFQYAMAGRAEKHPPGKADDFWSWREAMYTCALTMDPTQMQDVATMVYIQMLKRGYTHVAEFQYLHHDPRGKPYARLSEMSMSLLAAAAVAGIKITLVPVFYQKGGFGKAAHARQGRFIFENTDQYFSLLEESSVAASKISTARMGFGVHSLRAADSRDIIRIATEGPKELPFHIHAAEQLKEVSESQAYLRQRPVAWLLNNLDLAGRLHLVHCTHLDDDEVKQLGKSGAHVVLCPGTEGNLGDGIFRLTDVARHSDRWSIGTDSQISLNPLEDLRWLDYCQRLITHNRNTFQDGASTMFRNTLYAGRAAMGMPDDNFFRVGTPFDAAVFRGDHPLLNNAGHAHLLQTILYTADPSALLGTLVNGSWIIAEEYHREESHSARSFSRTLKEIQSQS